jgi:hypothetical protein
MQSINTGFFMTEQQETIVDEYLNKYPHSISRMALDFDSDEFFDRVAPLMEKALASNKPLTDAILNMPDNVDY